MEVKSVGKNVRMSHPQFGYANTHAMQNSLLLTRLKLTDSFENAVAAVSKKVILKSIDKDGKKFIQIMAPKAKKFKTKEIEYSEKELQKSNITGNFLLFSNKVSAAMLDAESKIKTNKFATIMTNLGNYMKKVIHPVTQPQPQLAKAIN